MEIPTEKVLESLMFEAVTVNGKSTIKEATLMVSIATIKAQAREILDLQLTICRLKDEMGRIRLDHQITAEARRVGH